ncbi:MAG: hypothetical protein AB7J13_12855 [Pyrinomonadaceae bacterium]
MNEQLKELFILCRLSAIVVSMLKLFQQRFFRKWFAVGLLLLFIPGFSAIVIASVFANDKPVVMNHCLYPIEMVEVDIQPFPNMVRIF